MTDLFTIDMSSDYTSDYQYREPCQVGAKKFPIYKLSVQIYWTGVEGTKDGEVYLLVTLDGDKGSQIIPYDNSGVQIKVDSVNNTSDVLLIYTNKLILGWKLVYEKKNITAGTMKVSSLMYVE